MVPRIGFNMWPFSSTRAGGSYYYAASLLREFAQLCPAQNVVIDGGSADGTAALAAKFARSGDILVSEPDRGMYDALNKGLDRAEGDIIGILNADDFYPHNRVRSFYNKPWLDQDWPRKEQPDPITLDDPTNSQ